MNDKLDSDPRLYAIPDIHGHAKGEHKAFSDERPIPLSARMLFLWFYHACRRGWPRFLMVTDHMNYLTFEDPAAINLVRRALKLAQAGDLYGAAETASVEVGHAAIVSEGLRRGMRYSIGAEVDNDPRSRPDAQNIVDAMKPDGMIRSVHFLTIDHPTHGQNWNWPFDNPEFADVYDIVGTHKTWELYMATLLDAIERLPGDIVGHFYVPALFGHWPDDAILDGYENALVDACETRGMAIEFNTRFLYRNHSAEQKANYLRAYRRLLAKCKAKNVGVAVGSDAHSPKDQGGAFAAVLAVLDECEINELVFPLAGRLARVALRVERKIEAPPELPAAAADERKSARKARPLEAHAREVASVTVAADEILPDAPKPKPRPKRMRVKSTTPVEPIPASAENGEGELAATLDPAVEPMWPGADDDSDSTGSESHSVAETHSVAESHSVAETHSATEVAAQAADLLAEEPPAKTVARVADILSAQETDAVLAAPAAQETDAVLAAPAAQETDAVLAAAAALEADATSPSDVGVEIPSAPETHSLIEGGSVVVDESHVSEAIEDMVSEAEIEPIVIAAEAETPPTGDPDAASGGFLTEPPVVETGAIVIETLDADGIISWADHADGSPVASESQAEPPKTPAIKGKPEPKKALKPAAKSAAKKAAPKKAAGKKTAILKTSAKKAAPKKVAAKKPSVKKAAVRAPGAKKATAKKAAAKKANPKKPAQRRR